MKRNLHDIVFSEENLFRDVKAWAFLLHNRLSQLEPIGDEEQSALYRVTSELLGMGYKLDELFDKELFPLGVEQRKTAA